MKRIRIGNGCGFWGDNLDAPIRLAEKGQLDYLTLEYLAELTMSILALLRNRDPKAGYATDFIDVLSRLGPILQAQPHLKIITNAGGLNPQACAEAARAVLKKNGIEKKIAYITGDDLLPQFASLQEKGQTFSHLDHGKNIVEVVDRLVSLNAYLGSGPIVQALEMGAEIVITGRVADACLTVGPALYEFGWQADDYQKVGVATAAGHLIECGAQVTGGLWTHWEKVERFAEIGYPIAELDEGGGVVITKPTGTGGVVNLETVSEQLLYEVADPARYYTPDTVADFSQIELEQQGADRVVVRKANGAPPTDTYKVSAAYRDGYMASGTLVIAGPNAVAKARLAGQIILDRLKLAGYQFDKHLIEVLGGGDCVPVAIPFDHDPPEVVLRVAVHDRNKAAVERFTKEFAPLVTSGPIGVTGYTTGRPAVREVFAYWPALVQRSVVDPNVTVKLLGEGEPA
jgi:hypothetical protein